MKKSICGSTAAKIIAFTLAILIFVSLCVFGLCYLWYCSDALYRQSGSFESSELARSTAVDLLGDAYWGWSENLAEEQRLVKELNNSLAHTNIHYTMQGKYGVASYSNREAGDVLLFTEDFNGRSWSVYRTAEFNCHDDLYHAYSFYKYAVQLLKLWPLGLGLLLCEIALTVFLAFAAARRNGSEELVTGWQERIPFDLYFVLDGGLALGIVCIAFCLYDELPLRLISPLGLGLCFAVCALIAPLLFAGWMTLCARIKTRALWKNTLTRRLLGLCRKAVRWGWGLCGRLWHWLWGGAKLLLKAIPLLGRTVIFTGGYLGLLAVTAACRMGFFFFLLSAGAFVAVLYYAAMLLRLQKGIRAISQGEQDIPIDTKYMLPELKAVTEDLGHIRDGITLAVEAQLKSERMKTELITNVSHDIKTPLTSLVSYVDLLQKESDEAKRQEYLDVLARQSRKLKKLTEDLVELSKSGSGAMVCTPARRSVRELLHQAVGEYEDKLALAGLECVLKLPEEELFCMADGNLTWRVLENLLGNACKYAQSGTRLYVSAAAEGDEVRMEVKNISREPLNIPAEELMERFKRGDDSRSTEGSGLGLSIADNLARLQGGSLRISIDGDLFKAVYSLKKSS